MYFLGSLLQKTVDFDLDSFTDRVKDIALSYTEIIHATEDQNLENIENQSFAHSHTRREQPTSTASTSRSNNTGEKVHEIFTDDQSDDDTEITNHLI